MRTLVVPGAAALANELDSLRSSSPAPWLHAIQLSNYYTDMQVGGEDAQKRDLVVV
jgi:hypothetical protein